MAKEPIIKRVDDLQAALARQRRIRSDLESVEYWLHEGRAYVGKQLSEYQSDADHLRHQLLCIDTCVVRRWLDEYVALADASRHVLDIAGNRVRRRTASQALLRRVGLTDDVRDSTLALTYSHIDRIVELTRLQQRLHLAWYLPFVATARPGNLVRDSDRWTARAVTDFGWTHDHVPHPASADAIGKAIADAYLGEMSRRLLPVVRKLARAGLLTVVD